MTSTPYHKGYYMNAEGSNYRDYRWLPDETIACASYIKRWTGMKDGESVLDFGCARGYMVKALRMLGMDAKGYDISEWAIANCDPAVVGYVANSYDKTPMNVDYVLAKDCFEHIAPIKLLGILEGLVQTTRKGIYIIVPLCEVDGGSYICPKDEADTTHVIRWSLPTWVSFLEKIDRRLVVSGGYYVPSIKQANTAWERSCGFFSIRRL